MVERIDLLIPPSERAGYGVLPHFTRCFAAALERCGVSCRLLGRESGPTPDLLYQILQDAPDCTLSFNGLLPDATGSFLCDQLGIPHVAVVVDSPNHFLDLAKSPLTLITCIDRSFADFFQNLKNQPVLFLPHAVDRDFSVTQTDERPYEVTLLGSCLDVEERLASWPHIFSSSVCAILREAVEISFDDPTIPYFQALSEALQRRLRSHGDLDPRQLNYFELMEQLEFVIRGQDRLDLVLAIRDAEVHVFGTKSGAKGWDYYLRNASSNIKVHGRISYVEALQVMGQSKILLNSCPSIRDGAHERIFAGLMAGAAIMTNDNRYIREQFVEDDQILLYRANALAKVNEELRQLLDDEARRQEMVKKGRLRVQRAHTWDHRAPVLIDHLNQMLPTLGLTS